jgi:hypothetical protein
VIRFETVPGGKVLGTIQQKSNGDLECSTPEIKRIVDGKRRAFKLTDAEVYKYFAEGGYDNGYVRAVIA